MLTAQQEEQINNRLVQLGAKENLQHELMDHWCVQVELEMHKGAGFITALETVTQRNRSAVTQLVGELQELRFPFIISPVLVKWMGVIAFLVFAAGIILRLSGLMQPIGLLFPGYFLITFVFLPLWFLRRLHTHADKTASFILFLNFLALIHLVVMWMNFARSRWAVLMICILLAGCWCWYYFSRIKKRQLL
jgi:hypothetical protein